jgi:uncharacterized membrane protein
LKNLLEKLRSTYWIIPTIMVAVAIGLSFAMISLDKRMAIPQVLSWTYTGGPHGARSLLSTVAGSMITVAGVIFSITMVALSLASSQFGPRLLRNFMRDTGNQIVLGTFVATFIYCLLVLRTIRSGDSQGIAFVPNLSVSVAVLLSIASIGVLIYFIHHVAAMMHVEAVIAQVGDELEHAIEASFPEKKCNKSVAGELKSDEDLPANFGEDSQEVPALRSGYLQAVDYDALMNTAKSKDLILKIQHRAGDFVSSGSVLARCWPGKRTDAQVQESVRDAFLLGSQRLQTQDIEYHVNQLVEVAVRSLSTGINDPYTAMASIDRLGASLVTLAEHDMPPSYRYDAENNLRLITDPVTFVGVIDGTFNLIRQNARSNVAVYIRLLEALAIIAAVINEADEREALRRHANLVKRSSEQSIVEKEDLADINRRYDMVIRILNREIDNPEDNVQ